MNRRKAIILFAALFLSGCVENSSVDYVIDDNTTGAETSISQSTNESATTSVDTGTEESSENWDDPDIDGKQWKHKITADNKNGSTSTITIDASIKSDYRMDEMNVYEFSYVKELTPEMVREIAVSIFGPGNVFKYNSEFWPKEIWQSEIEDMQRIIELGNVNDESIQYYREQIVECTEKMNNAPDEFIQADDYTGDKYMGYLYGKRFILSITNADHSQTALQMMSELNGDTDLFYNFDIVIPASGVQIKLEHLINTEELMNGTYDRWIADYDAGKNIADEILNSIGLDELTISKHGQKHTNPGDEFYQYNYFQGPDRLYANDYMTYLDSIAIMKRVEDPDTGNSIDIEIPYVLSGINVKIDRCSGVTALINGYYVADKKTEKTNLLSFDNLINYIEIELKENLSRYNTMNYPVVKFDHMELGYYDIANENAEKVTSVPCWKIYGDNSQPLFINAIDGSIINPVYSMGIEANLSILD